MGPSPPDASRGPDDRVIPAMRWLAGSRRARAATVVLATLVVAGAAFAYVSLGVCACAKRAPPGMESSADYHEANETLVVTHEGGTVFEADDTRALEVYVAPAGSSFRPSDREPATRVELPFEAGDSVAVSGVSRGEAVRLVWVGTDGTTAVLAEHAVQSPD